MSFFKKQASTLKKNILILVGLTFLTAQFSSCSSSEVNRHKDNHSTKLMSLPHLPKSLSCCRMKSATHMQDELAQTALRFIGASRIQSKGKRFRYDCSGLASAVYFSQGINLMNTTGHKPGDNGVRRIRHYVKEHGRFHQGPTTQPGDLVFFHNTYDANNDGKVNDRWTHVGIVEKVRKDGTVIFVSRVSRGIERYRMNVSLTNRHRVGTGPVLNDFLRRKRWSDPSATRYLSGELFATFGTLTH